MPIINAYASTAANVAIGTTAWDTVDNATGSSTANFASAVLAKNSTSQELHLTNYGFNLPAAISINSITARIYKSTETSITSVTDHTISLVLSGNKIGNNLADTVTTWPVLASAAEVNVTGNQATWGTSLVAADINDSTFGIAIRASSGGTVLGRSPRVYYVQIEIDYEEFVVINYWSGSAWNNGILKRWTGSNWESVNKNKMSRWTGSNWTLIP